MYETIKKQNADGMKPYLLLVFFALFTFATLFMLNCNVSAMSQLSSFILIAIGFMLPPDALLCLVAAILPTGNVFMLSGGNTTIPFLLIIYIAKSLIRNGKEIDLDVVQPLMWVLVLFFISLLTTAQHNIGIMKIIPFFMHLVFIVVALKMNHVNEEIRYNALALYFVVGTLLVCIGTVVFPSVSRTLGNASIYTQENAGFSSTWDFGRSLTISIAFVTVDFLKTKKRMILNSTIILTMLYFVIQSGRFSMLVGLGALLICLPFVSGRDKPLKQRAVYSVLTMIVIAVAAYTLIKLVYIPMTEIRDSGLSDNGRFDIWRIYFDYLNNNFSVALFGVGAGAISSIADTLGTATAHNIIIEKIVEVGFVGLFILMMYFIELYKDKEITPFRNVNILPLVAFLGTSLTQGTSGNVAFALLLAMCIAEKAST